MSHILPQCLCRTLPSGNPMDPDASYVAQSVLAISRGGVGDPEAHAERALYFMNKVQYATIQPGVKPELYLDRAHLLPDVPLYDGARRMHGGSYSSRDRTDRTLDYRVGVPEVRMYRPQSILYGGKENPGYGCN